MTMSRVLPNPRHHEDTSDHREKIDYDHFYNGMALERFQTIRRGYADNTAARPTMKKDRFTDAPISAGNRDKKDRPGKATDQYHAEINQAEIDYGYGDAKQCVVDVCEPVSRNRTSPSSRRRFSNQPSHVPAEIDYGYGDAVPATHCSNLVRHPIASRRSSLKSSNSMADPITAEGTQQQLRKLPQQLRRLSFGGHITILIDQKLPTTEAPLKKKNRWHDGVRDTSPQVKSIDRWGECTLQRSNSSNSMPMMPQRRNN
jgi:hypothetical protein